MFYKDGDCKLVINGREIEVYWIYIKMDNQWRNVADYLDLATHTAYPPYLE